MSEKKSKEVKPELKFSAGYAIDEERRFLIKKPIPFNKLDENLSGELYLADATRLHRTVVVKCLKPSFMKAYKRVKDDFEREIQVLCECGPHENIVEIVDYGVTLDENEVGTFYLVMEYVEALDHKEESFSLDEVYQIGIQMCRALSLIHSRGVLHRDVKPDNILVWREPDRIRAKLCDFGIVKYPDPERMSYYGESTVIGTPNWACPEQINMMENIDKFADTYSLAKTLYYFATGRTPSHRSGRPIGEEEFADFPLIPKDFIHLVAKATSANAEERYLTADSMKDDLVVLSKGEGIGPKVEVKPEKEEKPESPIQETGEEIGPLPPLPLLPKKKQGKSNRIFVFGALAVIVVVMFVGYYLNERNLTFGEAVNGVKNAVFGNPQEKVVQQEIDELAQLQNWEDKGQWVKILDWYEGESGKVLEPAKIWIVGKAILFKGKEEQSYEQIGSGLSILHAAAVRTPSLEKWKFIMEESGPFENLDPEIFRQAVLGALQYEPSNLKAKTIKEQRGW